MNGAAHLLTMNTSTCSTAMPAVTLQSFAAAGKLAALLLAMASASAGAGEVGALAKVFSWPDGVNNFGTYTKSPGGMVTRQAAGSGWKSYASSSFHALAAGGSATGPDNGRFGQGHNGGSAYWFEQITISSPSVAPGTQGRAVFTLYFDGHVSAGPSHPQQPGLYSAGISYRWAAQVDGADNVADPNIGESYGETVDVWPSYSETIGGNFRNQPRTHALLFRFGQPFDFTVAIHCSTTVWFSGPGAKARAELRCTGWNGFSGVERPFNVQEAGGIPVTDAVITSQTGFNYAGSSTTTYPQWASLYQLPAASMQDDSNGNGISNLLEYALGRNPLEPSSPAPFSPGLLNVAGNSYPSFTFTRRRLGGRPGDIVYTPKCGPNLDSWTAAGLETTVAPTAPDSDTETVTVRSTQPVSTTQREFLKLEVVKP